MTSIRLLDGRGWGAVAMLLALAGAGNIPFSAAAADRPKDARPELELGRTADRDYEPPVPGSYALPAIKQAGDGRVLTSDGKPHELKELLGDRITVLSFIYTRCADPTACPMASGVLFDIHQVTKRDSVIAENLQLLTFSFDPDHDTPQVMESYGSALRSADEPGCDWKFLTTRGADDLRPIVDAYGQRVDRKKDPNDALGPFSHLVRVYLIDRDAMIRNIYSFGLLDPRIVLGDVRTLLLEEAQARTK